MHQAQPKEGHKIWLTQEADAKSWSSLKHVQPKEGRKELAPREIKFRYRRLGVAVSLVYIGEIECAPPPAAVQRSTPPQLLQNI